MARVKIKGRSELIRIPNERARKLKDRWLGDPSKQIEKAERSDIVDLGDWVGEYSQISSIELDKVPAETPIDQERIETDRVIKGNEAFRKQSPEIKARNLEKFKVTYMMRNGFKEVGQEHIARAYQIQLDYFKAHPNEIIVPNEAFGDLLPPSKSSLADKMKISS